MQHIADVRRRLLVVVADLARRASVHDASKLVEPEAGPFEAGATDLKHLKYTDDEYQKASLERLGSALNHHWAANDHHPQHFKDGVHGMSLIHLLEMLADWHAAVERHETGDIRASIEFNAGRFGYGPELKRILHNTVDHLDLLLAGAP